MGDLNQPITLSSHEMGDRAHEFVGEAVRGAREVRLYVQEHAPATKSLGFVGGLALLILGVLGTLNLSGIIADVVHYVLYIYISFIGAMIVIVEGKWFQSYKEFILKYFYFFNPLPGKCAFYVFIGILLCSMKSAIFLVVGVYFFAIAAYFIYLHMTSQVPPDDEVAGQM